MSRRRAVFSLFALGQAAIGEGVTHGLGTAIAPLEAHHAAMAGRVAPGGARGGAVVVGDTRHARITQTTEPGSASAQGAAAARGAGRIAAAAAAFARDSSRGCFTRGTGPAAAGEPHRAGSTAPTRRARRHVELEPCVATQRHSESEPETSSDARGTHGSSSARRASATAKPRG